MALVGAEQQQNGSDEVLVARALSREPGAFEALVRRHYEMVFAVSLAQLRCAETADELAQEVFIRVYLNLASIQVPRFLPAWLCRTTRNLAADWQRRGRTTLRLLTMVSVEEIPGEVPDPRALSPRARCEATQEQELVEKALAQLPSSEREVVLLHFLQGLSKSDIARRLEIHPSSVGRQLERALSALRDALGADFQQQAAGLKPSPGRISRAAVVITAVAAMSAAERAALASAAGADAGLASIPSAAAKSLLGKAATTVTIGGILVSKVQISAIAVLLVVAGGGIALLRSPTGFRSSAASGPGIGAAGARLSAGAEHAPIHRGNASSGLAQRMNRRMGQASRTAAEPDSPPVELHGLVEDPQGRPLPGAQVTLAGRGLSPREGGVPGASMITDSRGRITVSALDDFPLRVTAKHPSYRPAVPLVLKSFDSETTAAEFKLRLRASHYLTGVVRHPDGSPASGTTVTATGWDADDDSSGVAATGPDGRYRIDGLSEKTHYVGLSSKEFGDEAGGETGTNRADADFVLGGLRQRLFIGFVVDWKTGEPLTEFSVTEHAQSDASTSGVVVEPLRIEKITGEPGMFRIPQMTRKQIQLRLESPEYAPLISDPITVRGDQKVGHSIFELGPPCVVTGTVVEKQTSSPLAGVDVLLTSIPPGASLSRHHHDYGAARTDELGRFRFETGQRGAYLVLSSSEFTAPHKHLYLAPARHVNAGTLEVQKGANVRMHVRGLPAEFSTARISSGRYPGAIWTRGSDDVFDLTNIPPGDVQVQLSSRLYVYLYQLDPGEVRDLSLDSGMPLSVRITRGGEPASNLTVVLRRDLAGARLDHTAVPQPDGTYQVDGVSDGLWTLSISSGRNQLWSGEVTLPAGHRPYQSIELPSNNSTSP